MSILCRELATGDTNIKKTGKASHFMEFTIMLDSYMLNKAELKTDIFETCEKCGMWSY